VKPSVYLISLIRTVVPVVVGTVIGWLNADMWVKDAAVGVFGSLDSTKVTAASVAASIGVYYALVRKLEEWWSPAGALLGMKSMPIYVGRVRTEDTEWAGYEPFNVDPLEP